MSQCDASVELDDYTPTSDRRYAWPVEAARRGTGPRAGTTGGGQELNRPQTHADWDGTACLDSTRSCPQLRADDSDPG